MLETKENALRHRLSEVAKELSQLEASGLYSSILVQYKRHLVRAEELLRGAEKMRKLYQLLVASHKAVKLLKQNLTGVRKRCVEKLYGAQAELESIELDWPFFQLGIAQRNMSDKNILAIVDNILRDLAGLYAVDWESLSVLANQYAITRVGKIIALPYFDKNNLLYWPLLAHEVGHIISEKYERTIFASFNEDLRAFSKKHSEILKRSPDKSYVREQSELWLYILLNWQYFWKKEIASDIIGVHLLGPSFAYASTNFFLKANPHTLGFKFEVFPYIVTPHPPDNVRISVILNELRLLSNGIFKFEAEGLISLWKSSIIEAPSSATYNMYVKPEIVESCVKSIRNGLIFEQDFGVDKWTRSKSILSLLKEGRSVKEETPIILNAAWLGWITDQNRFYDAYLPAIWKSLSMA